MVDVEDRELLDLELLQLRQQLGVDLVAGLGVDLAVGEVDDVLGEIAPGEVLGADQHLVEAALGKLARLPGGDFLTGLGDDVA